MQIVRNSAPKSCSGPSSDTAISTHCFQGEKGNSRRIHTPTLSFSQRVAQIAFAYRTVALASV